MYFGLYVFYALVQAILCARYGLELKEGDAPVGAVVGMTIFAPLVTAAVVIGGFYEGVKWLVTYKPKEEKKDSLPAEPNS